MAAIDFCQGTDGYPTSLVDINYATRWLKDEGLKPSRRVPYAPGSDHPALHHGIVLYLPQFRSRRLRIA